MSKASLKRIAGFSLFLGILLVFLFISNWVIYLAVASIFSLENGTVLAVLGTIVGFLTLSMVLSMILGMKYYNFFTRFYSLVSSVWIGYFVYLFLGSVLYGLLIIPFGESHVLGSIIIALALVTGTYGIIHAQKIHIKQVQVRLKNLPEVWLGRKAVWMSDLHLGQIHSESFSKKVVQKIREIPHDIILIGGDLFDGTSAPDLSKFLAPLKELKPELGIYFVTGNHEEFGSNAKFIAAINSAGIRVLDNEMIEIDGMQFVGVDYEKSSGKTDFKKILSGLNIDKSKPSILLKHEPSNLDIAHDAGISLQISGHTHRAQLWPLEYVANLTYKGYSYGLKKYSDMEVYVSSGVGSWGPPMRVGTDSEIVLFIFSK